MACDFVRDKKNINFIATELKQMKNLNLILAIILLLSSCGDREPIENIIKDVEINFKAQPGEFTCGEYCGTLVDIEGEFQDFKSKYNISDTITDKRDWKNKNYIATIKFLDETCTCKDGMVDPNPDNPVIPILNYTMIEIMEIREK